MADAIRVYLHYVGISFRAQMQYKASFAMMTLGQAITSAMEFVGIWALFDRFHGVKGWTFPEVAVLYGMVHVAFAISEAFARGFDIFPSMVKTGEFDRLLLRPRSTILQMMGQEVQVIRVGRLSQGVVVLLWGASALNAAWTPAQAALVVAAILGGACFFSALFVLQATVAFWTVESLEIANTVTYGGCETAQFPLSIYRPWFRRFFTFAIPLACVNYFPGLAILGRPEASGAVGIFCWLAPGVGVAFLLVSFQVWRLGVRHYCSTGS